MIELRFFNDKEEVISIAVKEQTYEYLANAGLAKIVNYKDKKLTVEGDVYDETVVELSKSNRKTLIAFIENERHIALSDFFRKFDDKVTVKELRDNLGYVRDLTGLYSQFIDETNMYFTYG
ncbi:hypothetical protein CGI04_13715 [Vibrio parahaemolyticus]|uniref:hypothetical protein n=1 Tax=Vibrio parahaemolyticus TaxID=670 RepID=UPI00111CCD18|nr:hypothetical protein [Vibrio parahaemolyticus]TOL18133.1 hypothetical protein CGI04_13715 [Vibrio parahaemolyticus]